MIQTRGSIVEKLKAGDRAVFTRTFTESDMMAFVGLSGDYNPHHVDAGFCERTKFGRPIIPGFLVSAMATHIGGQWAVLASRFEMDFLAPVFPGDTVTCEAVVEDVSEKYKVVVKYTCRRTDGVTAVEGRFIGYPPGDELLKYLSAGDMQGKTQ